MLERTLPSFSYHGLLGILAILYVAVTWGLGPATLAAAANALVLSSVAEPPRVAALPYSLPDGLWHLASFALLLAFGMAISLLSSVSEARRRRLIAEQADRDRLLAAEKQAHAQSEAALRRLQTVQAVTDASFAHLPTQELLQHLLARMAEALSVGTAELLLLSEDGQSLLVYLSHGGRDDQAAEILLPVGQGLAGRVASSRQPLIVNDPGAADCAGALLREPTASLAGVPVIVQDHLLGVLQAATPDPRHFTAEDVAVLQLVADRIGLAIENARLFGEERQRSDDLAAERDRLNRIVAMLPVGVVIFDADARITAINGAAQALVGAETTAAMVGEEEVDVAGSIFRLDGSPCLADDVPALRSLRFGEDVRDQQLLLRNARTNRGLPVLASSAPLRDASGAISGAVGVFQDTSVLKNLEQQRDRMLSTVTHDLRNPLTSISGMSQILQLRAEQLESQHRERFLHGLKTIEAGAQRMNAQIDELLDYARATSGGPLALKLESTDIVGLLRGVLAEHQPATDRHTLVLRSADQEIVALVDMRRMERAVANLVVNAIKYSPEGGPVVVSVARAVGPDGRWLSIQVSDSGLGIPPTDMSHIGEQYYRASNVAASIPGTGIGLAGVRHMIREHGGTVTIESTEGVGTTVTLRLPLRQSAEDHTIALR